MQPAPTTSTPWEPRSAFDAAWRFALGFGVSQPTVMLLLSFIFDHGLPSRSPAWWAAYAATVVLTGATVGVLWFRVGRRPAGTWRREWALASLGMVGFCMMVNSNMLPDASLPAWVFGATFASIAIGAAIAWFGRTFGPRAGV